MLFDVMFFSVDIPPFSVFLCMHFGVAMALLVRCATSSLWLCLLEMRARYRYILNIVFPPAARGTRKKGLCRRSVMMGGHGYVDRVTR